MIVAMSIMLMVQMTIHQIVDMIAVRYRLVATIWTVHVCRIVTVANMPPRAGCRIQIVHIERVLFDNSGLSLMMQMTVVQEVNVITVLDGCVSAVNSVDVTMVFVCMAHVLFPLF